MKAGKEITFFSLNAYLVPSFFLHEGEEKHCINLEQRAQEIGKISSPYSIVSLQELWGPSTKSIERHLYQTHETHGSYSTGIDILDVALSWGSGALWFAHHREMFEVTFRSSNEFRDTNFNLHRKSFTFHLMNLKKEHFDDSLQTKEILIITTHLDPYNENNIIQKQLVELSNYFLDWVENYKGNTENLVVMLNGDFNIDSKSELYEEFISIFGNHSNIVDVYHHYVRESDLEEHFTFSKQENDMVFYEFEGRIDYIFNFKSINLSQRAKLDESNMKIVLTSNEEKERVVNFSVPTIKHSEVIKYQKGNELSDHFAVSASLVIH